MHAIEKDRNRRFQTMQEFLGAGESRCARGALEFAARLSQRASDAAGAAAKGGQSHALARRRGADVARAYSPRPTTLEGAAAEVTLQPRRPPSQGGGHGAMIAGITAAVALVGVGGYLLLSRPKTKDVGHDNETQETTAAMVKQTAETPPPKPVPPVDDIISVTVASDPPGARVYRADKGEAENQPTPITFKIKKGDPPFDIQLRLEGYQAQTRSITSDESMKLVVSLAKLPSVAPVREARQEEPAPPKPEHQHAAPAQHPTATAQHVATPATAKKKRTPKKDAATAADDDMTIIQPSF